MLPHPSCSMHGERMGPLIAQLQRYMSGLTVGVLALQLRDGLIHAPVAVRLLSGLQGEQAVQCKRSSVDTSLHCGAAWPKRAGRQSPPRRRPQEELAGQARPLPAAQPRDTRAAPGAPPAAAPPPPPAAAPAGCAASPRAARSSARRPAPAARPSAAAPCQPESPSRCPAAPPPPPAPCLVWGVQAMGWRQWCCLGL